MPLGVWAQADYEYRTAQFTNLSRLNYGADSLSYFDTALGDFHLYHPIFKRNFGILDLGNSVTASFPVVFQGLGNDGFRYGWNYMDPYLYHVNEQNNLYKNTKPLTSLFYVQGANELIHLEARHSQNIKPNWNMGIDYRRFKEDGFYQQQTTGLYNTRLYNWYHTKDNRYHLIAQAVFNRVDNEESGGLVNQESFDTLSPPARQPRERFYGTGAANVKNVLRTNTYSVTQFYRIGGKYHFPTEAVDSLGIPIKDTIPTFIPKAQFKLEAEHSTNVNIYSIDDLTDLGYTNFYRDSLSTFDSVYVRQAKVGLSFQSGQYAVSNKDTLIVTRQLLSYSAGIFYNQVKVGWHNDYALYNNVYVKANIGSNPFDRFSAFEWEARGYLGLTGYNAGDHHVSGNIVFRYKQQELKVFGHNKRKAPDFFQYYHFGNHDFWFNSGFNKQGQTTVGVELKSRDGLYSLEVGQHLLDNYIYFLQGQMVQKDKSFGLTQAKLKAHLSWKVWHWEPKLVWQQAALSDTPWPSLATKNTVYAEGFMFKNALRAKLGIDFYYTPTFSAPVYDPAVRSWSFQGPSTFEKELPAYPYFNVFFTGRIKTVTLFMMFQNVMADVISSRYYSSSIYPMQPRAFRFGVKWKLYE